MINKKLLLVFLALFANGSIAAPGGVSGKISGITVKETGYLYINLQSPHSNPENCDRADQIVITHNHVAKQEILSVVLAAQMTNKSVSFWIVGCHDYYGYTAPIAVTASVATDS